MKNMLRRKVDININTRGIITFAKGKGGYSDWLLLVTKVKAMEHGQLKIYGHIFYDVEYKEWYFSEGYEDYPWGRIDHWDFYEPTKEEIRLIVDKLKRYGYKYVPVLNKLMKKTLKVNKDNC